MKRNLKLILSLILCLGVLTSRADETRYAQDPNFPRDVISVSDFRATLRGISQMDIGALRPSAKQVMDDMEYSSDTTATGQYSGTGVTITHQAVSGSLVHDGSFSLKAVTDGTSNRTFGRTYSINLSAFKSITIWERSSQTSDAIQFYLQDGSGNQSRWSITTNGSAGTWQQDTLTLASPSSNSGSPADLSNITSYGFRTLHASATYYFDTIKGIVGMTVAVRGTNLGSYYRHVTFGGQPLQVNSQASPTLTAPATNPRIDILTINSSGTLAWVQGTEASSPSAPWSSLSNGTMPICEVYLKPSMTQVLDYEDKDTDTNQGYILSDDRPFLNLSQNRKACSDLASASTLTLENGCNLTKVTGTTTVTSITAKPAGTDMVLWFTGVLTLTNGSNLKLNGNFVTANNSAIYIASDGTNWHEVSRQPTASTFIALTDAPNSYSGQGYKIVRVKTTEDGIEFISNSSNVQDSIVEDGSSHKIKLSGDSSSPGNNKFYGTNGSGTKGWQDSLHGMVIYDTHGSGTFNVPSGVSYLTVSLCGAGAGGGQANAGYSAGGAGATILNYLYPVTPGGTVSYTVGTGGTGTAQDGSSDSATDGTDTTFGTLTAAHGSHTNAAAGPGGTVANSGGGSSFNGSSSTPGFRIVSNITGIAGGNGTYTANNAAQQAGGSSYFGAGGTPESSYPGNNTTAKGGPCAGGAGGRIYNGVGYSKGGNGGDGLIVINY